ncbi:hypothetical protein [Hyperthermus butylicus]|uniref:Uncharacterized protein n=1 Tax=Hyperthermus butylicus (strain DSM 5456 / JCM 9403 / PLM1-5) TaxID=415426 RepID=A2BIU9_HYPBU|nr:hypothetical protein [Hyperthermus butylicus]ABM79905.1 hypothetical protein Hbut_0027 [Hyperthermus butylicus DSM 5456]
MPQVEAGSKVILIEDIIRRPELVRSITTSGLANDCRCFITDSPFVAVVERQGFIVEQVIGVGSIICSPDCRVTEESARIHAPTWGYGRFIGGRCIVGGDADEILLTLKTLGYEVDVVGFNEFFEKLFREKVNGVLYLSAFSGDLAVNEEGGRCGTLYSFNPLHPAGVFGKPTSSACVDRIYSVAGPFAKYLAPVLGIDGRPIIYSVRGIGDGIVIGYEYLSSSGILATAGWLGVLYACGSEREY